MVITQHYYESIAMHMLLSITFGRSSTQTLSSVVFSEAIEIENQMKNEFMLKYGTHKRFIFFLNHIFKSF